MVNFFLGATTVVAVEFIFLILLFLEELKND